MKKIFVVLLIMHLSAAVCFAHPPQDISIDIKAQEVSITVNHPVGDPSAHFIKKVVISRSGVVLSSQSFNLQKGDKQETVFDIPDLKKGDILTVEAVCSRFGSLKKEKTVD